MDTKLTKKYTLIFLLILNIFLFGIGILLRDVYRLTNDQKISIGLYLKQENINMSTELPKYYNPMPQISMKKTRYDELILQNIFFGNINNLVRTEKFENAIFSTDRKKLILNSSYLYFEDLEPIENFKYTKDSAKKIAEVYRKKLEQEYGKMYVDIVEEREEYIYISYIQRYSRYKIFNNSLEVLVYADGSFKLYFNNYERYEVDSNKRYICSADEALYTFTKEIKKLISDREIYITQIDLGYYLRNTDEYIYFSFEPYYRIFIDGISSPFYINAYTNTFEYELNNNVY